MKMILSTRICILALCLFLFCAGTAFGDSQKGDRLPPLPVEGGEKVPSIENGEAPASGGDQSQKSGKLNGYGVWTYENGSTLSSAHWVEGVVNGYGVYQSGDGSRSIGTWRDNVLSGYYVKAWGSGYYQMGTIEEGNFSGLYSYAKETGTWYMGQIDQGEYEGIGFYRSSDGVLYRGVFSDNNLTINLDDASVAQGVYAHSNGWTYTGDMQSDKMEGYGVYSHSDKGDYGGLFKDNCITEGFYHKGNDMAVSQFDRDWKMNGQSVRSTEDGRVILGNRITGTLQGPGCIYHPDGTLFIGNFKNGSKSGEGFQLEPNGNLYEGEFQEGLYDGHGVMRYANGDVYEGTFTKGKRGG